MEIANLVTAKYGYALSSWGSYLVDSPFTIKKGDPRTLLITCSIGTHTFHNALCDLGSSVNIMSKETYDRLFYTTLAPTSVYLQLADQSIRYLEGVATDLLVKVRRAYVPTYFMILDMGNDKDTPLILDHPFLNTKMLAYMWLLGKSNSTLLEEKKYLLLLLDNPSFMRIRKRRSNQRESR